MARNLRLSSRYALANASCSRKGGAMSNQQASAILAQIERIEKRMTALHEHGLDISALTSQLLVAREMLADARYDDAMIFCQELLDVADQIAQGQVEAEKKKRPPLISIDEDEASPSEETKKFQAPATSLEEQLKSAADVGLLDGLREQSNAALRQQDESTELLREHIMRQVSEGILRDLTEEVPDVNTKRVERALERIIAKDVSITADESDCLQRTLAAVISKTIDCSMQSFESDLQERMQTMLSDKNNKPLEDIEPLSEISVKVLAPQEQPQTHGTDKAPSREEPERDDDTFMGLPRIPKHGQPLEDDSTFRAVSIDPTLSASIYHDETATNHLKGSTLDEPDQEPDPSLSEGYEPVTGSSLRPNTSVFTEVNAINSPAPSAAEIDVDSASIDADNSTSRAFKALADSIGMAVGESSGQIPQQDQAKEALLHLLPDLLRDESVKQALFASLAVETVTKPSVLGSLTGLRDFIRKELQATQEGH